MAEKIQVLIVDDLQETRENVRKLLQFEPDVEVIGQAATGDQAFKLAKEHRPDIVLMDINMPGTDGIRASREITQAVPGTQIIIMSVQSEADYLRRAMLAGARDFLMKPFSGEELITAVRRVYDTRPVRAAQPQMVADTGQTSATPTKRTVQEGKLIVVYSPKGGVGCTTVAVNTAISLAKMGHETLLIDGSLQFGGVDVMLNLKPSSSIVDMIENLSDLDSDFVSSVLSTHDSGLYALLAPHRPEMAELVKEAHLEPLVTRLRKMFRYIIVDTPTALNGVALTWLDLADRVLLVAQQSLPSLKNVSRFFNLTEELDYPREKVLMVVNKEQAKASISIERISAILKRPVMVAIPTDEAAADAAGDRGQPIVIGPAERRPISASLQNLAQELTVNLQEEDEEDNVQEESMLLQKPKAESSKSRRFGGLFGGR